MYNDPIVIDLSYLYSITSGDKEFEKILLSGTLDEVDKKVCGLKESWSTTDAKGVRNHAHSLITLSAIAGMPQVEQWSRKIDNAFADDIFHPEFIMVANNIFYGWPDAFTELKIILAAS